MSTEFRAFLALVAGAVGIGLAPIFVRLVDINPVASAFWRLLLSLPLLFWLFRSSRQKKPTDAEVTESLRGNARLVLFCGFAFAADLAVWHYSIHYTSVANATLLANLAPVFIALWLVLVLRQSLPLSYYLGLLLALLGASSLIGASFELSALAVRGDALGVLTAIFYAMYQLSVAKLRQNLSTVELMFLSTLVSAALLVPLALVTGDWWPQTAREWTVLAALALFSHVIGQGLIAYALAHLSATFASAALLLQPMAAAGFAYLILAEALSASQAAGGVLVLLGIALCKRR